MNVVSWKEVSLDEIFEICAGEYYSDAECGKGDTPYISASNRKNGIGKMISLYPDFEGNKITIGKVGAIAFYQKEPFCATSDVNVLTPKFEMNENIGLFIVHLINKSANYKYDYGRQCRIGDSKKIKINMPVDDFGDIDYLWIDNYIKSLKESVVQKMNELKSMSIGGANILDYLLLK